MDAPSLPLNTPLPPPVERIARALAARGRERMALDTHRPAAVLVPLLARGGEVRHAITLRGAGLSSHAGQISFPGGRRDEGDRDDAATALREADEEIGLSPEAVRVLGLLDDLATPSGYLITPVVGFVAAPPESFRLNPGEVEEVFEVPLEALCDPAIFEDHGEVERFGRRYRLCAFRPDGRNIWGATARIAMMLLDLIDRDAARGP